MLNEIKEKSEIGDYGFPLEVDREKDLDLDHPHVGEKAVVNEYAKEILSDHRGKEVRITGVFTKAGQVVGYKAKIEDETIYGPKKDFYVRRNYVEDVHVNTDLARQVKRTLAHWQEQRDYVGPSWSGVELFNFELAKVTEGVHIESGGWYEYEASSRPDMDGKDWRLYVPDMNGAVVVNCHSILHDNVWTLTNTVHSTREVNETKLNLIGHEDHWQRTLAWTIRTAEVLATDGYGYEEPIEKLKKRKAISKKLTEYGRKVVPGVIEAYKKSTGNELRSNLRNFSIGLSKVPIMPGKVGRHIGHTDVADYSIMTVSPKALKQGVEFVKIVVKHELIHYVLNQTSNPTHNEEFMRVGRELGIPKKFLD